MCIVATMIFLIPGDTAVNVQMMAFGNMGDDCQVPVLHLPVIRLPEKKDLFGEFLTNAQGEDVVAGVQYSDADYSSWKEDMPGGITSSSKMFARHWKNITEICRIWSLR